MKYKIYILLGILILLVVIPRFFGLSIPYHQDEYKAAFAVKEGSSGAGSITHPPLNEGIYKVSNKLVGNDHLRFVPLFFFLISLPLLFFLMRREFGQKSALWSVVLFSISIYSVIASLMVDIDGAVMPFFSLCLLFCYFRWRDTVLNKEKVLWGLGFCITVVLGLLLKVTFGILVGALILDFLISKKGRLSLKDVTKYMISLLGVLALFGLIIWLTPYIFPAFNISYVLNNWFSRFFSGNPRNYLQIVIQVLKAVMYLSPLLLTLPFFIKKESISKLRPFLLFIGLGLLFYIVMFDFSAAALDRYLQYLILPLSIIGAVVISNISLGEIRNFTKTQKIVTVVGIVLSILTFCTNFLVHSVPSLHPKTEWISRVFSFDWNFLFPFTGGSGPLGFYTSFLFIALSFILCLVFLVWGLVDKSAKAGVMIVILSFGGFYNIVMAEEYLFGKINGNAPSLLLPAISFIENNKDIKKIVTYNDIGAYELSNMGKYERRLYVAPQFEEGNKETLGDFRYQFVLNIPRLNPSGFQAQYLNTCKEIFREESRKTSAIVYDCKDGDKSILK